MPFIRSLASKCYTYIITTILLLGKVMLLYFHYKEKKLIYITIIVLFSCQLSSYVKCTKLNIYLSYNIKLIFNTKYAFLVHLITY